MLSKLLHSKSSQLLGIDISSASIKLIVLSEGGQNYRVEAFSEVALPEGLVVEKEVKNTQAVAASLREVVDSSRATSKLAAIALGDSSVTTKVIQMDASLSEIEMEEQIMLEAGKHIPYPIDEVRFDFQILGQSTENSQWVDVLLAASRAATVDTYTQVLTEAGLTPKIVEVESFVIKKACSLLSDDLPNKGSDQTIAVVDVGANRTTFTILQDFLPVFTRGELFGGAKLTKRIASRYGLSIEEAEKAKIGDDLPKEYELEILQPFREDVIQQVSRAFQFYSSASQTAEINHVVLAGSTSKLPGLIEQMSEHLKVGVTLANPIRNMSSSSKVDRTNLENNSPSLLVCCGLALRSFDK